MDFRKFNEVAELVGIVAIVASLVFVGLELRQSQAIARADIEASYAAASIEMASLVSENSEVWAKGIAGQELGESETEVFESIITALSDRIWSNQEQMRLLKSDEAADAIVHEFAAFLHQRPGVRRAWVAREERLKADRETLDPWSAALTSHYVETILADLAVLDTKKN